MAEADHISASKRCKACGAHKPLTAEHWEPQKLGKYGFTARCRDCRKAEYATLRARPDQQARQKAWRDAHQGDIKAYNQGYRQAGYRSTAHVAAWRAENLQRARDNEARRHRERRATDPAYRMLCRIRARFAQMLGSKAGKRTEQLLGYTMADLRKHIELQFTEGMSWQALARGEIEIDHILPVSAFTITSYDSPEFRACWGLGNLRPMWSEANRRKGAQVTTLL